MSYSIFISYRREDSSIAVNSLLKYLQDKFGKNAVFADNESISSGDKWPDKIKYALEEAKIILVIIGSNWLCKEKNNPAMFRLCCEDDWVRKEIETAQTLKKIIIPVLTGVEEMPWTPELPDSIKALQNMQFRKINFVPGNSDVAESFTAFLAKKLKDLLSPDELKESLENILAKKYEIKSSLGAGNRARVYLGRDKGIERDIAIKVIGNPDYNDDFVDTLKIAAKINDNVPNCITVLGAYVDKDPYHVIISFLKKGSLRKFINGRKGKFLPFVSIKNILLDIGNALKQIHSIGLSHCNIKPSNIILDEQYDAYLNPMSRVSQLQDTEIINRLSDISAFPDESVYREELCYLPPEIFDPNPGNYLLTDVNAKIDQYMFGLLAYELLTGYIPNTLIDVNSLAEKGVGAFKVLPEITETRKDCPYKFSRIIHRMIEHDPGKRYTSLQEAIDQINQVSFDNFEIAKDSYERCMHDGDAGNNFFRAFYNQLLKKLPADQAEKFRQKGIGEAISNKQYELLREAIFILLLFGQNKLGDTEPNILSRIAEAHKTAIKVSSEAYALFLETFTDTVCGSCLEVPEPFDPQCKVSEHEKEMIRSAWIEALTPGIKYMSRK